MVKSAINADLAATLDLVAAGCAGLRDDWWVFGGAGMALAGAPGLSPPDVDLIVSARDAAQLIALWNAQLETGGASPLFRSKIFAKADIGPLPVEIMAGFEVREPHGWSPVWPSTRQAVERPGGTLFIPTPAEQAQICRRFGRPKDLARLPALEALI
ncbi:MAG: hypothetical protein V4514_19120 [Pseudomonadota bacterium]|uniref:hypothetical protein n=1 Tax=Phenylobacterium sp. TaxID=1871053 RepID=UPI0025D5847D|nr:hypothetical protein [Phenylobacterium sp.]MBT9471888.1 hypothetical protein [Phenylobacterium sp.]